MNRIGRWLARQDDFYVGYVAGTVVTLLIVVLWR